MFEDVGKKIKVFAKVLFWLEIIAIVVLFLFLVSEEPESAFISLLGIVLLPFCWFIYGFGEIVDSVQDINYYTKRIHEKSEEKKI